MSHRRILFVALVLLLTPPASSAAAPKYLFAGQMLRALPAADETTTAYSRAKFKHWIQVGRTGCTARQYVLWQETLRRPRPVCSARTGSWKSAYDGVATTNPSVFDIDHMIPLAEAWRSGASSRWDAATRQAFANDVAYGHSLIAVSASSNRSKGDKDPSTWLPPSESFKCAYVVRWVAVKYRWALSVDDAEREALTQGFVGCPRAVIRIPAPPRATVTNRPARPAPSTGGSTPQEDDGSGGIPMQPDLAGDQDCSDFDGPVRVLPGDPDDLDRDGDGIGCE